MLAVDARTAASPSAARAGSATCAGAMPRPVVRAIREAQRAVRRRVSPVTPPQLPGRRAGWSWSCAARSCSCSLAALPRRAARRRRGAARGACVVGAARPDLQRLDGQGRARSTTATRWTSTSRATARPRAPDPLRGRPGDGADRLHARATARATATRSRRRSGSSGWSAAAGGSVRLAAEDPRSMSRGRLRPHRRGQASAAAGATSARC